MEIKIENAKAAFNTADESVKKVLLALLPELKETEAQRATNRPITERVKTFEDACREIGVDPETVQSQWEEAGLTMPDEVAYQKLRIIAAALNEGWEPKFTEEEWRWYPWFYLCTEEELSVQNDKWKANYVLISIEDYSGDYAGFAAAHSAGAPSSTAAGVGSRLCFKSEALATYCGKQFISLWADFNLIRKGKEK